MIRQTLAIFLDAYRELNAKKLFWFVLLLSALVVAAFAAVGINERGVTVFRWEFELPFNTTVISRGQFYKLLFTSLGVGFWLTWIATVLALVSTAGIFPDFVTGGSIDLFLSKPISRLRLFLTKYAAGLLFVTLQVTVFSAAAFLVIGLRAGEWIPGLFIAVPVVVAFFSYLYCVCVFVGVLTRSTIAALLLTILFWLLVFGVHATELLLLRTSITRQQEIERLDRSVARVEREIADLDAATQPASGPARIPEADAAHRRFLQTRLEAAKQQREGVSNPFHTPHRIFLAVKTVLPKTSETVELLNRWLVRLADLPSAEPEEEQEQGRDAFGRSARNAAADEAVARTIRQRSVAWVLGTSLAFEAVVLTLAAWVFCRRDY